MIGLSLPEVQFPHRPPAKKFCTKECLLPAGKVGVWVGAGVWGARAQVALKYPGKTRWLWSTRGRLDGNAKDRGSIRNNASVDGTDGNSILDHPISPWIWLVEKQETTNKWNEGMRNTRSSRTPPRSQGGRVAGGERHRLAPAHWRPPASEAPGSRQFLTLWERFD